MTLSGCDATSNEAFRTKKRRSAERFIIASTVQQTRTRNRDPDIVIWIWYNTPKPHHRIGIFATPCSCRCIARGSHDQTPHGFRFDGWVRWAGSFISSAF
jgi:hypothetical protein